MYNELFSKLQIEQEHLNHTTEDHWQPSAAQPPNRSVASNFWLRFNKEGGHTSTRTIQIWFLVPYSARGTKAIIPELRIIANRTVQNSTAQNTRRRAKGILRTSPNKNNERKKNINNERRTNRMLRNANKIRKQLTLKARIKIVKREKN
jgi:hypothetical protein